MAAEALTGQDLVDLGWIPPVQPGHARAVVNVDLTKPAPDFLVHVNAPAGMDPATFVRGCAEALQELSGRWDAAEHVPDVVAEAERITRTQPDG